MLNTVLEFLEQLELESVWKERSIGDSEVNQSRGEPTPAEDGEGHCVYSIQYRCDLDLGTTALELLNGRM